jgi:hypothetical protein
MPLAAARPAISNVYARPSNATRVVRSNDKHGGDPCCAGEAFAFFANAHGSPKVRHRGHRRRRGHVPGHDCGQRRNEVRRVMLIRLLRSSERVPHDLGRRTARASSPTLHAAFAAVVLALSLSCGSDDGPGYVRPAGLASTCATICDNVLAQCGVAPAIHADCVGACQFLELAQVGCIDEFASYLVCLGGATSVSCGANGQYVVLSPPNCQGQRLSYGLCTGDGPPLAACLAQPHRNGACAAVRATAQAHFCVGQPVGCQSLEGGGAIGLYCCP